MHRYLHKSIIIFSSKIEDDDVKREGVEYFVCVIRKSETSYLDDTKKASEYMY